MRTLAALAVLLLAGVALLTYVSWPHWVDRWVDWRLDRAKRRFAAGDFRGSQADAEAVLLWRPRSAHAELLRFESLFRRMNVISLGSGPVLETPTCGIALPGDR